MRVRNDIPKRSPRNRMNNEVYLISIANSIIYQRNTFSVGSIWYEKLIVYRTFNTFNQNSEIKLLNSGSLSACNLKIRLFCKVM